MIFVVINQRRILSDNICMKNKIYTAAIVGCGRIGFTLGFDKKREQPASHTMALLGNKRIKLIAGCDTNKENLESWKKYTKVQNVYESSDELYSACKIDIVVIAVNENAHLKEALNAIRTKPKLVILEKPVALNSQEAELIYEEAGKNKVDVLINHERRFAEDYILAKDFMKKIGPLQSIKAELCSSLCVYNPEKESTGGYSLIHDGTHLVDVVMYLLEDENRETILKNPVMSGIFRDEENNVRQLCAHYSTEKCPEVSVSISGRSRFFGFEVIITGTEGRIVVGNGMLKFYRRKSSKLYTGFYSLSSVKIRKPKKTLYFANMVQNAVDYLDGSKSLRSTLKNGISALKVLEEIKSFLI